MCSPHPPFLPSPHHNVFVLTHRCISMSMHPQDMLCKLLNGSSNISRSICGPRTADHSPCGFSLPAHTLFLPSLLLNVAECVCVDLEVSPYLHSVFRIHCASCPMAAAVFYTLFAHFSGNVSSPLHHVSVRCLELILTAFQIVP